MYLYILFLYIGYSLFNNKIYDEYDPKGKNNVNNYKN